MKSINKIITTLILISMLLGVIGSPPAVTYTEQSRIHPLIYQIAQETPAEIIRVVIQTEEDSASVVAMLERLGGVYLRELELLNAFVAKIPAGSVDVLAANQTVTWITLDAPVVSSAKPQPKPLIVNDTTTTDESSSETDIVNQLPPNTYLETLNVREVWDMGYTGNGIGIAIIDSGISPTSDLNVRKSVSFNPNSTSPTDIYGHGTHVAGIASSEGYNSHGYYIGVAPGAHLLSLKISDDSGLAYESDTVAALEWVYSHREKYNIRVVNLSIQSSIPASYHDSPMNAAAEILWHNGLVIVVASGNVQENTDYKTTNAAPANDPYFITVGATDENGTTKISDDFVAGFTSISTTLDGQLKPDIMAPGVDIVSILSNQSDWETLYPDRTNDEHMYFRLSGTSMAAPMVSGAAAILLQAEPNLTPDQVKYRLLTSSKIIEGWPYLNVYNAITKTTVESANQGLIPHMLLAKMAMIAYWANLSGVETIDWSTVDWEAVNWEAVDWENVDWDAVNWESVNWNSVNWNAVNWNAVNWNAVNWNAVNWNAVNWNAVNWNAVNWNSMSWASVTWNKILLNNLAFSSVTWNEGD